MVELALPRVRSAFAAGLNPTGVPGRRQVARALAQDLEMAPHVGCTPFLDTPRTSSEIGPDGLAHARPPPRAFRQ